MITSRTNEQRKKLVDIHWLAANVLLAVLVLLAENAEAGHNEYARLPYAEVDRLVYTHPLGYGEFIRMSRNRWAEVNPDGVFSFEEYSGDRKSVWLHDATRNVWIVLDLEGRAVRFSQHGSAFAFLYPIVPSASRPEIRSMRSVRHQWRVRPARTWADNRDGSVSKIRYRHQNGAGVFVQIAPRQWLERNPDGQFRLDEKGRYDQTIELHDPLRNIWVLIDLGGRSISMARSGEPYRYRYATENYY